MHYQLLLACVHHKRGGMRESYVLSAIDIKDTLATKCAKKIPHNSHSPNVSVYVPDHIKSYLVQVFGSH
jgi:hypothetical protein